MFPKRVCSFLETHFVKDYHNGEIAFLTISNSPFPFSFPGNRPSSPLLSLRPLSPKGVVIEQ